MLLHFCCILLYLLYLLYFCFIFAAFLLHFAAFLLYFAASCCVAYIYLLRPALIWAHFAARRRSCRLLGNICGSLITCRTGRRRRPRAAAPAGEDLPGPREGVRALRRSRLSGRSTPRRGRGARGRASSHGRGARLPSWSDREPRGLRDSGGRPRRSKRQQKRIKTQQK